MARRTRSEPKRPGFKLDPLLAVTVRMPAEHWEKLAWLAADQGIRRADMLRILIAESVRGAQPPKDQRARRIRATEAEWARWQRAAEQLNVTFDSLVRQLMARVMASVERQEDEGGGD